MPHGEHGDDVRVLERGGGARLTPEALGSTLRLQELWAQDLEGDATVEALLHGVVDDPHAPTTDLSKDPEFAEALGEWCARVEDVVGGEAPAQLVGQLRMLAEQRFDIGRDPAGPGLVKLPEDACQRLVLRHTRPRTSDPRRTTIACAAR